MCGYCVENINLHCWFQRRSEWGDVPRTLGRPFELQECPDLDEALSRRRRRAPPPKVPRGLGGAEFDETGEPPAFLQSDPPYEKTIRQLWREGLIHDDEKEIVVCRVLQGRLAAAIPFTVPLVDTPRVLQAVRRVCTASLREVVPRLLHHLGAAKLSALYDPATYSDPSVWESFLGSADLEEECRSVLTIYLNGGAQDDTGPLLAAWAELLDERGLPALCKDWCFGSLFRCFFFAVSYLERTRRNWQTLERVVTLPPPLGNNALDLWLQRRAFLALLRRTGSPPAEHYIGRVRNALIYYAAYALGFSADDRKALGAALNESGRPDDYDYPQMLRDE